MGLYKGAVVHVYRITKKHVFINTLNTTLILRNDVFRVLDLELME